MPETPTWPPLPSDRPASPARLWAAAALLCLGLGVAEALASVFGSRIAPGAQIEDRVAAGMLAGNTLLRAGTVALMLLLACGAQRWLPAPTWQYGVALLVAVLAGTVASWAVYDHLMCGTARAFGYEMRYGRHCGGGPPPTEWIPLNLARQLQHAVLVVGLVSFHARGVHADRAAQAARLRRLALDREFDAGRVQLLQAQIEPHFLFNTLANLRRLLRTDAAAGLALLADLRRYLQQALPHLRGDDSRLADEMALVRSYLDLHAVRMGPRLQYAIELPAALQQVPVPPMLLLTLVENAIKHGLQPLPEGGRIDVAAAAAPAGLVLTVRDSGRGMGDAIGHGTGLANLRGRLKALYGGRASLSLQLNEPSGLRAVVTLPATGAGA